MKNLTLFLTLFGFCFAQAQIDHQVSFGPNQVIHSNELSISNGEKTLIHLGTGTVEGDFSRLHSSDHLSVNNGQLKLAYRHTPVCYTSNAIDVRGIDQLSISIAFSGEGTLDKYGDKRWLDWIDISHSLDGSKEFHALEGNHTITGVPSDFDSGIISTYGADQLKVEICVHMTGLDESYTIENINVSGIEEEKISVESSSPQSISFAPELNVFPNPSSQYIYLKDETEFQLDQIQIFDQTGRMIRTASYPVDVSGMATGVYLLQLRDLSGTLRSKQFVVSH